MSACRLKCRTVVFFTIIIQILLSAQRDRAVTPVTDATFYDAIENCLAEAGAEVTGECTTYGSTSGYGTMPNWDTSLVTDMSGYGTTYQGFGTTYNHGNIRNFNGDISRWDTSQVTNMYQMFRGNIGFNLSLIHI